VRDVGETSIGPLHDRDNWPPRTRNWRNFKGSRWAHDRLAVRALGVGRTRSGMRVLDVIRAVEFMRQRFSGNLQIALVGEERGAIWGLKAAALDRRIGTVVALRMLPSYRLLTESPEYNQFDHFWVPGALLDYDVCDLPALVAPRCVAIADAVDQMGRRLTVPESSRFFGYARRAYRELGASANLSVVRTAGSAAAAARAVLAALDQGSAVS
jgi:hypothetical protein